MEQKSKEANIISLLELILDELRDISNNTAPKCDCKHCN